MWTQFYDRCSGGGLAEPPYEHIYIEAPEDEAAIIFYNRFGHNPYRISCTCCGEDYSTNEYSTLEDATGYHRNCAYNSEDRSYSEQPADARFPCQTLHDYTTRNYVKVIKKEDINENERTGTLPNDDDCDDIW